MGNAIKSSTKGSIGLIANNPQLKTQGTAVSAVAYSDDGAIAEGDSYVTISGSKAMTLARPRIGRLLVISQSGAGTNTVTTTAGTFDGTNNTATFNAAAETLVLLGISNKRWLIIANIGSVALSSV